ncbi:anterior gradient 1 [Menidia menidia]
MFRWVLFALLIGIVTSAGEKKKKKTSLSPSRGWGNNIRWVQSYDEGLSKMAKSQKPLMVIHHRENCPHSQALKSAFAADKTIQNMAKGDFIMLNLVEETPDPNLAPDGYYVPRILFVDPSMTVRTEIAGKYSNHLYTYEPDDMEHLAENMKRAKVLLHSEL